MVSKLVLLLIQGLVIAAGLIYTGSFNEGFSALLASNFLIASVF